MSHLGFGQRPRQAIRQEASQLWIVPLAAPSLLEQAVRVHSSQEILRHLDVDRIALGPRGTGVDIQPDVVASERSPLLLVDGVDELADGLACLALK